MQELFKKYDLELEESEIQKFKHFLDIFIEKNSQINLSAIRDESGIIEKHFIDSIMLNAFLDFYPPLTPPLVRGENNIETPPFIKEENSEIPLLSKEGLGEVRVADLGTGGGFPLIPLAIINPLVQFTGIDSVGKKLKAIDEFTEKLKIKNVKTLNGRAEELGQNENYRENFDFVVSRATAYLPTLLEYTIPLLKVGGIFCAYKLADKEELKSSKKALQRLGAKIMKVKNYEIGEQKRTIIFIEKIKETHKKYPRNVGVPLVKPL